MKRRREDLGEAANHTLLFLAKNPGIGHIQDKRNKLKFELTTLLDRIRAMPDSDLADYIRTNRDYTVKLYQSARVPYKHLKFNFQMYLGELSVLKEAEEKKAKESYREILQEISKSAQLSIDFVEKGYKELKESVKAVNGGEVKIPWYEAPNYNERTHYDMCDGNTQILPHLFELCLFKTVGSDEMMVMFDPVEAEIKLLGNGDIVHLAYFGRDDDWIPKVRASLEEIDENFTLEEES